MLGYISAKPDKPELIKDFPTTRVKMNNGLGFINYINPTQDPLPGFTVNKDEVVSINENLSYYKINDDLKPEHLLKRNHDVIGSPVLLPDGNNWFIPKIRISPSFDSDLPSRYYKDFNGERFEILNEYKKVQELSDVLWNLFVHKDETIVQKPIEWLTTLLSVNYYVTEADIEVFGLFSRNNFMNVIVPHVIDSWAWYEYQIANDQKKTI